MQVKHKCGISGALRGGGQEHRESCSVICFKLRVETFSSLLMTVSVCLCVCMYGKPGDVSGVLKETKESSSHTFKQSCSLAHK